MKVTINPDHISATGEDGTIYNIKGLVIRKPPGQPDAYYPIDHSFCKVNIFRGLKCNFIDLGEGNINLL